MSTASPVLRPLAELRAPVDAAIGANLHALVRALYPICRSITGDGVRATLARVSEVVPLALTEVPTGTQVLDWTVPAEWNIRDAWIATVDGRRIVDFRQHSLHVVGYSTPIRRRVSREELLSHLHSLPAQPDLIPYRTSYYRETWGFCVQHRLLETLGEPEYEVCIDADLAAGALTYGEYVVPGRSGDEVLLSCHVCHPSLANDNLSAIAIAALLARQLSGVDLRYSYGFLFIPGTIGAITWLARNNAAAARVSHGLVLACLGDGGAFTYKRSRRGDAEIDRLAETVLADSGVAHASREFSPYGYDERQYCSPGFNLPVGRLTRSAEGEFPEYHTSADDCEFVTPGALAESYRVLLAIVDGLEANRRYRNLSPYGEPQLGWRGLYAAVGGVGRASREMAMLWVLNQSDGTQTLLDIARRSSLPFAVIRDAADALEAHHLLAPCDVH